MSRFPQYFLVVLGLSCLLPPATPQEQQPLPRRAKEAARQRWYFRQRAYPQGFIPAGARAKALAERNRMLSEMGIPVNQTALKGMVASPDRWTFIGPQPLYPKPETASAGSGVPYAAGRTTSLAVDPRNADVAYVGAANGGVWKTTDAGQNWTPLTDNQPILAIGALAIAPSKPDTIYAGTGEANFSGDSYTGDGMLKSTDAGATWTRFSGPFVGPFSSTFSGGGARFGAIVVSPTDPSLVLAAVYALPTTTRSGIYRSTDGGTTWTNVLNGSIGTDVVFDPQDPTVVYAALGLGSATRNGIYKSTDSGVTWTLLKGTGVNLLPTATIGRVAFGISHSSPRTLYTAIAETSTARSGALKGVWKTTDGGQNWTQLPAPDYCNPQCFYDLTIQVSPTNPNLVVAGGSVNLYRSIDGGATWRSIFLGVNGNELHADQHALAFSSDGLRLYDADDGGVFSSDSITGALVSWNNLNQTLGITEFTPGISIHPTDINIGYGGTQDNGTLKYSNNLAWDAIGPGDGGFTAVDFAEPTIVYGSTPDGRIYKFNPYINYAQLISVVHGIDFSAIPNDGGGDVSAGDDPVAFYAPFVMDPSDPQKLYFGSNRVYQSIDGGGLWKPISPDLTGDPGAYLQTIAVAAGDANTIYAGTVDGYISRTTQASQGAQAQWTDCHSLSLPSRAVSYVAVDPLNPKTVYATFSGYSGFAGDNQGHVFRSTDGCQTWTDISNNLPNIPANVITVDPDVAGTLYLGTDVGVFRTQDIGGSWSPLAGGLPPTVINDLVLHRPSRTLRAATHGRGMYDLLVPAGGGSIAPVITAVSPSNVVSTAAGPLTITVSGTNLGASTVVWWNGANRPTTFANGTLTATLAAGDVAFSGRNTVVVYSPTGGLSNGLNVNVGPAPASTTAAVVSAANPKSGAALVGGSIVTIYGTNLASTTVVATTPPLPTSLGGVTVELGWEGPVPLLSVSPTQISFQVPWGETSVSTDVLTITNGLQRSAPIPVTVTAYAPALFSLNQQGAGQGAVLIAGPEVLAAPAGTATGARPAKRGEYLELYGTGLGSVTFPPASGNPGSTTTLSITRAPQVTIGGVPAKVVFSGLSSSGVGLNQIDVQVPNNAPAGNAVPVQLTIGGVTSNLVTVAIADANAP